MTSNRQPTPNVLADGDTDIMAAVLDGAGVARETPANAIHMVPLAKIRGNPFQTRIVTDPAHISKLALSIHALKADLPATLGLQQPPMARLVGGVTGGEVSQKIVDQMGGIDAVIAHKSYTVQLMFGHSRFRAFELLAYGESQMSWTDDDYLVMPLLIGAANDKSMWTHAVTENAARKDISGVEEAHSLRRAMDEFGLTTAQAATPFGWKRSTAANKLRLLQLPESVQNAIVTGEISEKHGRLLLRLASAPTLLETAYQNAIDGEIGTRALSEQIDAIIEQQPEPNGWPMDWDPGDGINGSPSSPGPCTGCGALVELDGRDACISPACYALKHELWPAENERRQVAAKPQIVTENVTSDTASEQWPSPHAREVVADLTANFERTGEHMPNGSYIDAREAAQNAATATNGATDATMHADTQTPQQPASTPADEDVEREFPDGLPRDLTEAGWTLRTIGKSLYAYRRRTENNLNARATASSADVDTVIAEAREIESENPAPVYLSSTVLIELDRYVAEELLKEIRAAGLGGAFGRLVEALAEVGIGDLATCNLQLAT